VNFAFNQEQQALRESARSFLRDNCSSDQLRASMQDRSGYDQQLWRRICDELGWPALTIPEEYGGLGLGCVDLVALMEVMGEALLASPFFATVCLATASILAAASEEQQAELLPAIAAGQTTAALALTESSGVWEASAIETIAESDGSGFVLSGSKTFVSDGADAELLVVAARERGSEGSDGISLFVVAGDAAGLERRPLPTMDQTRRQAEIVFREVHLDSDALLGRQGQAWPALQDALNLAAIALGAEQVGGAERCLDMSVAYAKERVQFGRPIGSFQAIKHKCADMLLAVESARSAVYYAAAAADSHASREELSTLASLAKAYCSDAYFRCAAEAIQIHGGVGFTWEYDVHLHFKRAKSSETLLGDAAYHRELVARQIGL